MLNRMLRPQLFHLAFSLVGARFIASVSVPFSRAHSPPTRLFLVGARFIVPSSPAFSPVHSPPTRLFPRRGTTRRARFSARLFRCSGTIHRALFSRLFPCSLATTRLFPRRGTTRRALFSAPLCSLTASALSFLCPVAPSHSSLATSPRKNCHFDPGGGASSCCFSF